MENHGIVFMNFCGNPVSDKLSQRSCFLPGNANTDYGVIVSCDHKERTCMVKWMKPYFPGKSHRYQDFS